MAANDGNPYLAGPYAPTEEERTWRNLEIVGELPDDLHGCYVRNGPNPRFEPPGRHHWFDGDGMLHGVYFRGGSVDYRNRWVQTSHLAREVAEGRALWRGLMESTRENPADAPYKDTANTDVLYFGGELLALWYLCGRPYRVGVDDLSTVGPTDFDTGKPVRISAHAKVCPTTGELHCFDYGVKPPFMHYSVVGADGALIRRVPVPTPGPRLPHDMALTERFAILMDLPVFFKPEALAQQRWIVDFHRDMPARFAVVPRQPGEGDVRWFEASPCYIYHVVNAWEEDDEIVMVGCRCADPLPTPDPSEGVWASAMANLRVYASLHEWRFNLQTGETRERPLCDRNSEFPAIDAGLVGRPSRFGYNVLLDNSEAIRFCGLLKYELSSGKSEEYAFGDRLFGSEPVFARRPGANAEDDGYLISFVEDVGNRSSEVWVFDATDIPAGPRARVRLPGRVPLGFHACWVPA